MLKFFLILIIFFFNSNILAEENDYFLMLKYNKVNVRYGPNKDDQIKFVYKKKYLPLKVIDKKENFRKIIDHKNNNGWIHISQLKSPKSLIVMENKTLFKKNSIFSKPIIKLEKGKLVLIKKCKENWCKIKTNKITGWLRTENVWGIN
jgi:SH3-like domain-containing protein|tara:strand:- start:526 stop:969 length:444 start_codon:yes stop_codon:yes gene_type:complete